MAQALTSAPHVGRAELDRPAPSHEVLDPRTQRVVALVSVAGVGVIAALLARSGVHLFASLPALFWLVAALACAGELFPIRVSRGTDVEEITTSTTFAFAILLGFGTTPAVVVLAVSSAVADAVHRKPLWKILFNLSQYALAMGAAGLAYGALGAPRTMTLSALGPILAAGIGFFVVNDGLTGGAVALAEGVPVVPYLLEDLRFQVAIASALLSLAPIVLISADDSIWFVPLLAVPVAAVYWGASASLQNTVLIARLEESLAHLTELNRLKDDFVAVVSHELRTPLTSIQGYVKTLLQLDELEDADRRSFLEAADRQGDRLRRLIEQLLVTSRLETHEEPLSVAPVSIPLLVRQVVEEVRAIAHGHTFDVRVDPSLHAIESDEAKIHQIVSNLAENALKYSPPDTRVTIRANGVDEGIAISVADEGPGIAADAREHVFERFYQADSSTTRKVGGTGLGLYICRKMTESLGGRLTLDRTGHDGSVFTLWVPLELAGSVADGVPEADAAGGRLIDLSR